MLQDVIMDIAKDQVEYVFSDMETEFYSVKSNGRKYLIGLDECSNIRYYKLI